MLLSERYALVIGINSYEDKTITSLNYAHNDATKIADKLRENSLFSNSSPHNVTLLLGKEAKKDAIINALEKIGERLKEDDLFIFYFAGHGSYEELRKSRSAASRDDNIEKFLVPYDAQRTRLKDTAIKFSTFAEHWGDLPCKRNLALLDCCYSGAAGGRTFGPNDGRGDGKKVGKDYLNVACGAGKIIMTSCTGLEVAYEDSVKKQGVFTYHVLRGLEGQADYKKDGLVDLDELWMYVSHEMTIDDDLHHNVQTPVRAGWVEGAPIFLSQEDKETLLRTDEIVYNLVTTYKLNDVIIATSENPSDPTLTIPKAAAEYLKKSLKNNKRVAVSCGRTLIETIHCLERSRVSGIEIFPLNGSPNDKVHITDSMVLTYLLWSKLAGEMTKASVVPTGLPAEVLKKVEEDLARLSKDVLDKAMQSHVFIFGIGNPEKNSNIAYLLEQANLTVEDLKRMGVAGEINFQLYDHQGRFLVLDENVSDEDRNKIHRYNTKFFSINAMQIVELVEENKSERILVAGGYDKKEAILGALRGRLGTVLITDHHTGDWLARQAAVDAETSASS